MHITNNEIFNYISGQVDKAKAGKIKKHLDECQTCREGLERFKKMDALLKNSQNIDHQLKEVSGQKDCPEESLLYGFIEGSLSHRKQKNVEGHLNRCDRCLALVGSFIKEQPDLLQVTAEAVSPALERRVQNIFVSGEIVQQRPSLLENLKGLFSFPQLTWPARVGVTAPVLAVVVYLLFFFQAPLQMEVQFIGSPGLTLRGEGEITISDGAVLRSGDRLHIIVHAEHDSYFYILALDSRAHAVQLFPVQDINLSNFIRKGETRRIPPDMSWPLDEHPGTETIFVAFSRKPVPDIDSVLREMEATGLYSKEHLESLLQKSFTTVHGVSFEHR